MNQREIKFRAWDKTKKTFIVDALLLGKTESKKWMILPSEKNAHDKWTEKIKMVRRFMRGT